MKKYSVWYCEELNDLICMSVPGKFLLVCADKNQVTYPIKWYTYEWIGAI